MDKPHHLQRNGFWLTTLLVLATGAIAQTTSIQLPPDNATSKVKAAAGDNIVSRDCGICHSTDYIVRQPHLDAAHWDAEVKKMVTVFGAPISDADAKMIADYLAKNYGPDATEPQKTPAAKP